MSRKLLVADLFCGAGGTTAGAMRAIHSIGREVEFVAVNHWPIAIATHEKNHPDVRHYCKDLDTANPSEIVPEGKLDLLLASPECRFHSTAQGGRPLDEQNRASAWHVVRWAERLYIKRIVVENVPRFVKWGPLDRNDRPIKKREGELFNAWVKTLEAMGYRVEWRVLNAADYGTPQTRKRLFVQARRDGRRIVWPDQTHARRGLEGTLHGTLSTWTPARAALRLDKYRHLAKPVAEKDLSEKTLARIAEGVRRFCSGPIAEAFLVTLRKHADVASLEDPFSTITTSGNHHALLEPIVVPQGGGGVARAAADPLPTIATDGAIHVVEPFMLPQDAHLTAKSIDDPLSTIRTQARVHVVEPFVFANQTNNVARSVDELLPTITTATGGGAMIVEPFLVKSTHLGERPAMSLKDPLPTITAKNGVGVVEPFLVAHFGERQGQAPRVHSVDEPLPTVTHRGAGDLVEPFLIVKRQESRVGSLDDPLPTITTSGRNHFVIEGNADGQRYVLLHRMLQPEELGRGQDFDDYEFTGTREQQTRQIGNAVPVLLAQVMTAAALHDLAPSVAKGAA